MTMTAGPQFSLLMYKTHAVLGLPGVPDQGKIMRILNSETQDQKIAVRSRHQELCTEAFGEFLGAAHSFSPIQTSCEHRFFRAHEWYTDQCGFGVLKSMPYAMRRTKPHIQDFEHLVLFSRLLEGRTRGTSGDDVINRRPGPIYVSDQARPFEAVVERNHLQSVLIPKAILGLDSDMSSIPTEIHRTCMAGKLVHTGMDNLFAALWRNDDYISASALDRFIACLKIAMGAAPQRADIRAHARDALFDLICSYIEQNLGDFALSMDSIRGEFGVSRSSLYRMFEDKGGVRNYITERRAVRAILEISEAPQFRGQIRIAAERWGFLTPPTFSRTIHRIYGASPGSLFSAKPVTAKQPLTVAGLLSRFASRTAAAA